MRNPRTTTTGGGGSTSSSTSSMEKSSSMNNNNINNNINKKMTPCCSKVGIKRGPWTPEEDEVLAKYINKEGEGRWRTLPKRAGLLRCGKSCRLRWMNYLRPSVKRGHIAPDEEDLILRLHRLLGNRWSLIAGRIPGRTDNEIKNYWNTHLSKKLISQGIDPRTHKPLLLNPSPNSAPTTPPPPPHHHINKLPSKTIINSTNNTPPISNPNPNPKPNGPTPYITDVQPPDDDHHFLIQINNKEENGFLFHANNNDDGIQNTHEYPNYYPISSDHHHDDHIVALPCADDDHQDMNCCSDEIFSSFLNSLINDDAFAAQHQLQLQQVSDPNLIATTTTYGLATTTWDSALLSSTTTAATFNNHNNHHPNGPITDVDDQIE